MSNALNVMVEVMFNLKCPNQRTLFLKGVNEYSSYDDEPSGKEEENNESISM